MQNPQQKAERPAGTYLSVAAVFLSIGIVGACTLGLGPFAPPGTALVHVAAGPAH